MASDLVTIGVPVYSGEEFLDETLRSIQSQTHRNLEVIVALDGPDPACERIVTGYAADPRFSLVVQPERLGWYGNINWLMEHRSGDFWIYHGQDDVTSENYVEALVGHADSHPGAALVYADMIPFGRLSGRWVQPSVHGASAFIRQMTLLSDHYPGVAFHGLTRAEALAHAGDLPANDFENVATDTAWMAAIALSGELHRIDGPTYHKRFHGTNVSGRTATWSRERRLDAWSAHCVNMVDQALRCDGSVHEARQLWLAAVARLTAPLASHLFDVVSLSRNERSRLLGSFLRMARESSRHDVVALLDMSWLQIVAFSRDFFWLPSDESVEIVDFGPQPVGAGQPFNVQSDGTSAVWARTSRPCEPGSILRLGDVDLDTVVRSTALTATVPAALTRVPGTHQLAVVRPDGAGSGPVDFEVRAEPDSTSTMS